MDQQTVNSLISQSINGNQNSFRKLIEHHQPFVYAVAFRMLCNDYETEEIVQETFIRVWKTLERFDTGMQFRTWLYKIAVNLCYDRIRAVKRLSGNHSINDYGSLILNYAGSEDPETTLINKDTALVIRVLTQDLTPKQKVVFTLIELECLPVEEVAEITGLSHEKIKSNLYCARQNIKKLLSLIEEKEMNHVR
ncbi:MAG TPA: RNA polymerase sigma factor [Bacteroidales bacterium]|nr:RNA polymerase sigma factor [Bacteroidales bacterium]